MFRLFTCLSITVLLMTASCKKGDPVEVKSFGFLEVEMVRLPGTPDLAVYLETTKLEDSLKPGGTVGLTKPVAVSSNKNTRVSFRKKGSDEVLLDTSILAASGEKIKLRIAFSEDLGLKTFLKGNSNVSPDSCSIQLFNRLPTQLQDDSWEVDVVLYKYDPSIEDLKELTTFQNFRRSKLHPKSLILPIKETNGEEIAYYARLKNAKTGEFITDNLGSDLINIRVTPGKELIISILDSKIDNGDGTFTYMFTVESAEL